MHCSANPSFHRPARQAAQAGEFKRQLDAPRKETSGQAIRGVNIPIPL